MSKIKVEKSKRLVSASELAKIWGVSRAHVSRLVLTGRITEGVTRVGEQLVFDLNVVVYPETKMKDKAAERNMAVHKAAAGA